MHSAVTFSNSLMFFLLRCAIALWLASPFAVWAQTLVTRYATSHCRGRSRRKDGGWHSRFLDRKTQEVQKERDQLWDRADRIQFVTQSRQRFRRIIGAVDNRVPIKALELVEIDLQPGADCDGSRLQSPSRALARV